MKTWKEVFGRFDKDIEDRDVEILMQLFLYQEEYGNGITSNKFEKLMKKKSRIPMAYQTFLNHIIKLAEMGLVEKRRDEKSQLHYKPTYLRLTERSLKSLRLVQSSKLQELVAGLSKINMEGDNIADIAENIINVLILSLGRLLKRCLSTDDPYVRTILFNVTYDLIKQVFEHAISNAERSKAVKMEILQAIESTFKPYTRKYDIEL